MSQKVVRIFLFTIVCCSTYFWQYSIAEIDAYTKLYSTRQKRSEFIQTIQDETTLPQYPDINTSITQGDFFTKWYTADIQRQMFIWHKTINTYTKALIHTQQTIAPVGSTSDCSSLTPKDISLILNQNSSFRGMTSLFPLVFDQTSNEDIALACQKWSSCVGGTAIIQYNNQNNIDLRHTLCVQPVMTAINPLYQQITKSINFDRDLAYINVFSDGSGSNAPFELTSIIQEIQEIFSENINPVVDSTTTKQSTTRYSYIPQELLTSTQQLLQALTSETSIDPRKDQEIASLITKATTVSGSSLTTRNQTILNACVVPTSNNTTSLLQQLQQTQQFTENYNNTLNTSDTINSIIKGYQSASSLVSQPIQLSDTSEITSIQESEAINTPLDSNPLGNTIAKLPTASTSKAVESTKSGLMECVSTCQSSYGSTCQSRCLASGGDKNRCQDSCTDAGIACKAACLCEFGKNSIIAGESDQLRVNFEVRRCVVPTSNIRPTIQSNCLWYDDDSKQLRGPSLSCLLGQTEQEGTYSRESGKGGLLNKPRERTEGFIKFDLRSMIRFTINQISNPTKSDLKKKEDIQTSINTYNDSQLKLLPVKTTLTQQLTKDQKPMINIVTQWSQLRKEMNTQAQSIKPQQ